MLRALLPRSGEGQTIQEQLEALYLMDEIVISPSGRPEYKQRMTPGLPLQDVWAFQPGTEGCLIGTPSAIDEDVRWLGSDTERLGYPTQKPLGLLDRIIRSSSNIDDRYPAILSAGAVPPSMPPKSLADDGSAST